MLTWRSLNNLSGYTAFGGNALSRIKLLIPHPLTAYIIGTIGFLLYITSYLLWLAGSYLHPSYPIQKPSWYAFEEVRIQDLLAAIIGLVALTLQVVGMFVFPPLGIVGLWVMMLSNAIWVISSFHRYKNHPDKSIDPEYDANFANVYFKYALGMTLLSLYITTCMTLCILLPIITPIVLYSIPFLGVAVLSYAYCSWFDMFFYKPETNDVHPPIHLASANFSVLSGEYYSTKTQHRALHSTSAHTESTGQPTFSLSFFKPVITTLTSCFNSKPR